MARVISVGQPENESERQTIAHLRDSLPSSFVVIHNFEIRQGFELFEIDLAIIGPQCVFVVDIKGTQGLIDVYGSKWYPEGRAPYQSPLAILRKHAKVLKTLVCDHDASNAALRQIYVQAAVILTAPDARIVDPEGRDTPFVTSLRKSVGFFQNIDRIPSNFTRDIRQLTTTIERTILGKAKPKSTPACYGNWQIEEKLGGNDRFTEFRARHVMLGDRRGGNARLRVYQVDPYLAPEERKRREKIISNAFRAVANLPGHPNILAVREFFETEAKDRYVLVTEDVAGHALRQHIKKSTLSLTYDQKIGIVRDVLSALDHAHRSEPQVVHRNLTPDSVLVSTSGKALLTGFDYARAGADRSSSSIADKIVDDLEPVYQAPECYKDPSKTGVLSDLYSAGLVFFELLAGELPFSSIDDMMEKDGRFPIAPSQLKPELPAGIDEWLQSLCAFDSEDRFPSAAVARDRFNEIVGPDPREVAKGQPPVAPKAGQPLEIDYTNLPIGFELGRRFTVQGRLGRPGGFAVAYKVFDALSDTSRVLKLVVRDRRSTLERLKQEYKALLSLKPHPNVVKVEWADQLPDQTPYIVFEYVPGFNVEELIDSKALSLEDSLRIAKETVLGLQHLHSNGLYHRDIKPSNLLWTDAGVKIIDFNVAVKTEDADERQGGTRRYLPPDLDLTESASPEQDADRDLFALGVTLFECVTGGKYPWEGEKPSSTAARLAVTYAPDLSVDFAQLIQKAVSSNRKDRFGTAIASLTALAAINSARKPVLPPVFPSESRAAAILSAPEKPNFNRFVSQLQSMYSQSRGNAGTRGLDEIGKQTYVSTLLDTKLRPAILEGKFRLVIITGNAGDGKTAFIQQLESDSEVRDLQAKLNGSTFQCRGRKFLSNYDGSQDEESKANDEVLQDFFAAFRGTSDASWPKDTTRLIAINEGRLVDFLTKYADEYRLLEEIVRTGLAGNPPQSDVAVINLNLRAIVAEAEGTGSIGSIFERMVRTLVDPRFWSPCESCDLRKRCYIYHNVQTLQDGVAGPKVTERLKKLYDTTHLRAKLHITLRDLRSALAYTIAGTRDCDQVHTLYTDSSDESRREVLNGFYFNSWRGREGTKDRLLSILREIDIGEASNPELDRGLDYLSPDDLQTSRFTFATRPDYDGQLLAAVFRRLPREMGGAMKEGIQRHKEYVGMLRRRQYFERRDEGWSEMLPYASAIEFWEIITGNQPLKERLRLILAALNRGEGLTDPGRLGNSLALRVRVVERGTVRSYRLFDGTHFELRLPPFGNREFLEQAPQNILLVYSPPSGDSAELQINLDVYEMLKRLNAGYRPNLEELQGYYLSLSVFKNMLGSAPYQEVLVTRSGYDFYRIRRDASSRLHLEAVRTEMEARV